MKRWLERVLKLIYRMLDMDVIIFLLPETYNSKLFYCPFNVFKVQASGFCPQFFQTNFLFFLFVGISLEL